jgi:metal-dependent hydrolase (beta-lactamase superfamily II)
MKKLDIDQSSIAEVFLSHAHFYHIGGLSAFLNENDNVIIGGLHGFNEFELFKDFGMICHIHCTKNIAKIKSLYPEKYIEGGVGKTIEI